MKMIFKIRRYALMLILLFAVMTFASCQTQGTKGLQYEMLEDGTYCVSGYDGKNTKVTIPSKHNSFLTYKNYIYLLTHITHYGN